MERINKIPTLGHWNLYFLLKLLLLWKDYIGFNALYNLAFAAFLLFPVTNKVVKVVRQLVAIPLGFLLFYNDSWLPPLHRVFSEAALVKSFNATYLLELVGRFVNLELVALLMILLTVYAIAQRYIRLGVPVVVCLIYLALPAGTLFQSGDPVAGENAGLAPTEGEEATGLEHEAQTPDAFLSNFFRKESTRNVAFEAMAADDVNFDIIYIHVCSISWDDLQYTNLEDDLPLFHLVFDNFNTAASYSGPAAIRALRGSCGQSSHQGLYEPTNQSCHLFKNLEQIGFETQLALNHDGQFDDFLKLVQNEAIDASPMVVGGLPVPLRAFDGSPVYRDHDIFMSWLEQRAKQGSQRVALFYNTVTLHDGNRYTDNRSRMSSIENFSLRMESLLKDLNAFFFELEKTNRNTLVIMVPEHGAAVQGDKMQIPGLREIPSPSITLGPVGVRLIGPNMSAPVNPVRTEKATSYLDLTKFLGLVMAGNPFGLQSFDPASFIEQLEGTTFVSENAGTVVLQQKGQYKMRFDTNSPWVDYRLK